MKPQAVTADFHTWVGLGKVDNVTRWNKFGYNSDVSVGTETVWAPGGTYAPITTAGTLSIVSSSANDTNSGTGAHGVVVYGIDENYDTQVEVVFLSGQTPVVTTNSWYGVNRVALYRAGSGKTSAGNITVTQTSGGATHAYIPAGDGTTQQCLFWVARAHTGLLDWAQFHALKQAAQNPVVTFKIFVFSAVSNAYYEVARHTVDTAVENTISVSRPPLIIGEKSLIEVRATTDQNATIVAAQFSLLVATQ